MKILHSADWHIGQKLRDKDRTYEHKAFLDWLTALIDEQEINILVVAGDVFDTANPSGAARELYYNFLAGLLKTNLDAAVIVAGNHDSPQMLAASAEILKHLKVYVVGAASPERLADCLIPVYSKNGGELLAGFAAAPYLRHQDLLQVSAEDTSAEIQRRLRSGIKTFYDAAAGRLEEMRLGEQTPLIATGHLFAQGGQVDDSMRDIHVGNLGQVSAEAFSPKFDYVALGHLHRPQKVGGEDRIRYPGSPLPLSFSELNYQKQVLIAEFDNGRLSGIKSVDAPLARELVSFEGTLSEIASKIENFTPLFDDTEAWAQIFARDTEYHADLNDKVAELLKDKPITPLIIRCEVLRADDDLGDDYSLTAEQLEDLDPKDVFAALCAERGFDLENAPDVQQVYFELVEEAARRVEENARAE